MVTNIITKAINNEMKNAGTDYKFYDIVQLNEMEAKLDEIIQDELININNGEIDDYFLTERIKSGRFRKIKNGILCDVSIGSIRDSSLFANVGPTIPIRLLFSNSINSYIDVDISEYGINNAIIKVYFNANIDGQITMPISSKRKQIQIRKILDVDIVNGQIPNYYAGLIK